MYIPPIVVIAQCINVNSEAFVNPSKCFIVPDYKEI